MTIANVRVLLRSGYNAYYSAFSTGYFGADHKPQRNTNPFLQNPERDYWLRGWREAEKACERGQYLQVDPFETTYGMREAARYFETKERAKARKFKKFEKPEPQVRDTHKIVKHTPWKEIKEARTNKKPYKPFQAPYGKPKVQAQDGPVNLNRLNKFNTKYRTVV